MNNFNRYIEKNKNSFINIELPEINASIFIVIPCYNEPDIISTINSLSGCYPPKSKVALLVVVNSSEDSPPKALSQNLNTLSAIEQWKKENTDSFLKLFPIHRSDLPRKFAGVGLARKIGMDAVINQIEKNGQKDGIIVSLDADCTVSKNYLIEIERPFEENDKNNFFTIDFSHPVNSETLSDFGREGIIRYELHMRYYRNAMEWSGYPHSIHTVGSSFAVRASAYVKQGGMNRRKAGEDFYFLHKLVLLGLYGNISSTTIYPSARLSDRVPFGTGAAMKKWNEGNSELMTTYSFDAFLTLKLFFQSPERFFGLNEKELWKIFGEYPAELREYIKESGTDREISELQANCSNATIFVKRFFHLINAFWILKYLNFGHKKYFKRGDLFIESVRLLSLMGIDLPEQITPLQILELFRTLDRNQRIN